MTVNQLRLSCLRDNDVSYAHNSNLGNETFINEQISIKNRDTKP
jgi:hypothetical protein